MESGFYQIATAREAKARGQTLQDVAARLKRQGIPFKWTPNGDIIARQSIPEAPKRESTKPLKPALKAQQRLFNRLRLKILKGV